MAFMQGIYNCIAETNHVSRVEERGYILTFFYLFLNVYIVNELKGIDDCNKK
jgi:hypothetical protein